MSIGAISVTKSGAETNSFMKAGSNSADQSNLSTNAVSSAFNQVLQGSAHSCANKS